MKCDKCASCRWLVTVPRWDKDVLGPVARPFARDGWSLLGSATLAALLNCKALVCCDACNPAGKAPWHADWREPIGGNGGPASFG